MDFPLGASHLSFPHASSCSQHSFSNSGSLKLRAALALPKRLIDKSCWGEGPHQATPPWRPCNGGKEPEGETCRLRAWNWRLGCQAMCQVLPGIWGQRDPVGTPQNPQTSYGTTWSTWMNHNWTKHMVSHSTGNFGLNQISLGIDPLQAASSCPGEQLFGTQKLSFIF